MRFVGVLLLVGVGAGCSRRDPSRDNIAAMLREDAGYTRRLITFEIGSPDASLPEFQAFCDKAIEQRTERLIKIQAIASSTSLSKDFSEIVDLQLESENSLVRGKRRLFEEYLRSKTLRENYNLLGKQAAESERVTAGLQKAGQAEGAEENNDKAIELLTSALAESESRLGMEYRRIKLAREIRVAVVAAADANVKWSKTLVDFFKIENKAAVVYKSNAIPVDRLEDNLFDAASNTSKSIGEIIAQQIPK